MVGGQEFDVAGLSASEFISLAWYTGNCPFVALAGVSIARFSSIGYIFINKRSWHSDRLRDLERAPQSGFPSL
jgi:hypothetical protein